MGKKRGNGEGSIYRRKSDGLWVGSLTLDNGKRKPFYGKTKKEVTDKLIKARGEQQQGTLITAPNQTLESYLVYWLEAVKKPTIRVSTYVKYRNLLHNHILPVLGKISIQKLTPQRVQALYSIKLKQGLCSKTVVSIHGVLHNALDNAVKWSLVARNVCDVVTPPRVGKSERPFLNLEQVERLLDVLEGHRLGPIVTIALMLAMRRGEILALRWSDVNLEEATIEVKRTVDYIPKYGFVENEAKTQAGMRVLALPTLAVDTLKAHRVRQLELKLKAGSTWENRDLVFTDLKGGYFNPRYLEKLFKQVLVEASLPPIHFHDLRHSSATLLLKMGVDMKVIQLILGHSNIQITSNIYLHVSLEMLRDAMSKWDNAFKSKDDNQDQEEAK